MTLSTPNNALHMYVEDSTTAPKKAISTPRHISHSATLHQIEGCNVLSTKYQLSACWGIGFKVLASMGPWYAGSVNTLCAQELRAGQAHDWLADPGEVVRLS